MEEVNWQKVRDEFELDMGTKLNNLPGHREVPENLKEFRGIISHELPETSSTELFQKLIAILLEGKPVNIEKMRNDFLEPELRREAKVLDRNSEKFHELKASADKWVRDNFPEERLQTLWEDHKTWLPRRYTIYENPNLPFQQIARDTLSRYFLIASKTLKDVNSP
jgi:hypothetical protein